MIEVYKIMHGVERVDADKFFSPKMLQLKGIQ